MRDAIASMLTPPKTCQAHDALKMRDRRRGAIWHCPLARKITGKGRKQPPCLCAAALSELAQLDGETL
jgi:hypothetical protein